STQRIDERVHLPYWSVIARRKRNHCGGKRLAHRVISASSTRERSGESRTEPRSIRRSLTAQDHRRQHYTANNPVHARIIPPISGPNPAYRPSLAAPILCW